MMLMKNCGRKIIKSDVWPDFKERKQCFYERMDGQRWIREYARNMFNDLFFMFLGPSEMLKISKGQRRLISKI